MTAMINMKASLLSEAVEIARIAVMRSNIAEESSADLSDFLTVEMSKGRRSVVTEIKRARDKGKIAKAATVNNAKMTARMRLVGEKCACPKNGK